jgi:hypothetical protein
MNYESLSVDPFRDHYVSVFRHTKVPHQREGEARIMPIRRALLDRHTTDAMLCAAVDPDVDRRLITTPCYDGCPVHREGESDLGVDAYYFGMVSELDARVKDGRPHPEVFAELYAAILEVQDEVFYPSIVYATKSWAVRLVHLFEEPIRGMETYARKWQGLRDLLERHLQPRVQALAYVDRVTADPVRLWRCPRVRLDDGRDTYDRPVLVLNPELVSAADFPEVARPVWTEEDRREAVLRRVRWQIDGTAGRKRKYALGALRGESQRLSGLADGRRTGLFHAAIRLGTFVGAGLLDVEEVTDELRAAARAAGLQEPAYVDAVIQNGLDWGFDHPWRGDGFEGGVR